MLKVIIPVLLFALFTASCEHEDILSKIENQANIDRQKILKYLQDSNLTADTTENGLFYTTIKEGTGSSPDLYSLVKVSYNGYLLDGTQWDYIHNFSLPSQLINVSTGFSEGVRLMKRNGKAILYVPSRYGFGSASRSKTYVNKEGKSITLEIPGNSVLIYKIELLGFSTPGK